MVFNSNLHEKIQLAWNMASKAHKDQFYINGQGLNLPYVNHIGGVLNEIYLFLLDNNAPGTDAELLILTAILHDVVEDTEIEHREIAEVFGIAVADGVLALSKNPDIADKHQKLLDSLSRIKMQPPEIAMVKMADRIVNLQPPPDFWTEEKKEGYLEESVIIYENLKGYNSSLAQRLLSKIENYPNYFRIKG